MARAASALCAAACAAAVPAAAAVPSHQALIAHLVAPVDARAAPGTGPTVAHIGALARWNGGPVGLLVLSRSRAHDGRLWLRVRLPERPNEASAWIPANMTELSETPWSIVVSLAKRTVTLERNGRPVHVYRAVVGKPSTPTPTGDFAVSERVNQPNPHGFYGPWVLLLTAYSNTLLDFGGGPGQIGIHGRDGASLRDPLGTARSHGCIRIDDGAIETLARVAVEGTPVVITR